MKTNKTVFILVLSLLLITSVATASPITDWFSEAFEKLGLGAFVNNGDIPSGYSRVADDIDYMKGKDNYVVSNNKGEISKIHIYKGQPYLQPQDCSTWTPKDQCVELGCEYIFGAPSICKYPTNNVETCDRFDGPFTKVLEGVVPDGTSQSFSFGTEENCYKVSLTSFVKDSAETHLTKVYYHSGTSTVWQFLNNVPEGNSKYCKDKDDSYYNDFGCENNEPQISSGRDALACFKQEGNVYASCEGRTELGQSVHKIFDLDDGSGLECCSVTFTNFFGGDIDEGEIFGDSEAGIQRNIKDGFSSIGDFFKGILGGIPWYVWVIITIFMLMFFRGILKSIPGLNLVIP